MNHPPRRDNKYREAQLARYIAPPARAVRVKSIGSDSMWVLHGF